MPRPVGNHSALRRFAPGAENGDCMASETLHEDPAKLGPDTIDRHRAISSLMEELEAVDWYDQRARATSDAELRSVLEHNRDEEKEHAAMVIEWVRRRDASFDRHLRTYLFTDGSIVAGTSGRVRSRSRNAPPAVCDTAGAETLKVRAANVAQRLTRAMIAPLEFQAFTPNIRVHGERKCRRC